jgi:formylglycine-generating enzyme required for sulfatase activity
VSRKEDLEQSIRESYRIIREYEAILRTSDRPEERARARRAIDEQWDHVKGYLAEYSSLVGGALPEEIAQIAARSSALAELSKVEQALSAQEGLRGILPDEELGQMQASLVEKQASIRETLWGGVSVGPVDGQVAFGDGNVLVQTETYIAWQEVHGAPAGGPDREALRRGYLAYLLEKVGHLFLSGVDPRVASDAEARLELSAVYTALLTLTTEERDRLQGARGHPGEREPRRLSALELLDRCQHLVLLGGPGSGKSTFVRFAALCLAGEALGREDANLRLLTSPLPQDEPERREEAKPEPQPWSHGTLLPVSVVLRDFAARGLPPAGRKATAKHLCDFVAAELDAARLKDYVPHLENELREVGGLLLLDGLDEVPEANRRREQIRQVVTGTAEAFPRCRIVVTSRTYAYQQQAWRLPGYEEAVLAPFGGGQIRHFVDRWYAHIGALRGMHANDSQRRAQLLKGAIQASPRLRELAERPLLLTLMASLHAWRGGGLPEKREELYADMVDLLLDWWEGAKATEDLRQPSLSEWLKVDRDQVRMLLNRLAYRAHERQPDIEGTADIAEGELLSGLMRLSQNPEVNPARLVEYLSQRAGLLLPRGVEVYTYPHRTFQEYLAACHLTDHDYPDLVAGLARGKPERWWEVVLLAGAKAARGTSSAVWALADALCYAELLPGQEQAEADAWGALFAGQALAASADLEAVSDRNRPKVDRVRSHLARLIESGRLPAAERCGAGDLLARLGDVRHGVGLRADDLPDIAWCEVQEGAFRMGSTDADGMARDREKPQHEVGVPGFRIGRYPVTNVQYGAFVGDGGYTRKWQRCWTDEGWDWKGKRSGPERHGGAFDLDNHPAVGVTWYEAIAFCGWLTQRLRKAGELQAGEEVTLPSEAQWEKAARGTDGRIYPWGNEFNSNRANSDETGIGTTSAVGCFPGGASPYGVLDMSGNVWEWCRTQWQESYEDYLEADELDGAAGRVVRGGSFDLDRDYARCAYRGRGDPDVWGGNLGVRLVVSPIS